MKVAELPHVRQDTRSDL